MLEALPECPDDLQLVAWLGRRHVAAGIGAYQKAME